MFDFWEIISSIKKVLVKINKIKNKIKNRFGSDFFELIKHGKNYISADLFTKGLAFISIPIFTRLLVPEEYGILAIFLLFIAVFTIISGLSVRRTMTRYYYEKSNDFNEYAKFGMKDFYISINHKGKMIKAYLEDHEGDYFFRYISENKFLGTAGALKYLDGKLDSPFFVSNCDIIIKDDYTKIYDFHKKGGYALTLVASMQHHTIPYGVCEIENGGDLKSIIEKPQYDFLVNTGMYVLDPEVLGYIPENEFFHITHLMEKLKKEGLKIGVYPVSEKSYIDVGQWNEYKNAMKVMGDFE